VIEPVIRASFRPEFLNRLDEIVLFHALTEREIAAIVGLQLAQVETRLKERRILLKSTDPAKRLLAESGFDPQFGARPLKRAIQRLVVDPLTMKVLAGEVPDGSEVTVDVRDGRIALTVAAPRAPGRTV